MAQDFSPLLLLPTSLGTRMRDGERPLLRIDLEACFFGNVPFSNLLSTRGKRSNDTPSVHEPSRIGQRPVWLSKFPGE